MTTTDRQTRIQNRVTELRAGRLTFGMVLRAEDALREAAENHDAAFFAAHEELEAVVEALGGHDAVYTPVANPIGRHCDD